MSFADQVKQAVEEAPSAGFVNVNYGRLTTEINVLSWEEVDGKRQPVRIPFAETDGVVPKGSNLELKFKIHISELNEALNFDYERSVNVKNSSGNFKTSWSEIVLPSLVETFGDDWAKIISDEKATIYVAAEHVDSVEPVKEGKKNYGVPKFIARFKNMAECIAAREERFGKPSGEEVDGDDDEIGIPADIIKQAKSLFKSVKGNEKQFRKLLSNAPFDKYDADAILAEME